MKHIKLYEEFVNEASTVEVVYQGPIKKYQDGLFKARKENDGTYTVFITADRQIVDVPYSDVRLVGPKVNEEQLISEGSSPFDVRWDAIKGKLRVQPSSIVPNRDYANPPVAGVPVPGADEYWENVNAGLLLSRIKSTEKSFINALFQLNYEKFPELISWSPDGKTYQMRTASGDIAEFVAKQNVATRNVILYRILDRNGMELISPEEIMDIAQGHAAILGGDPANQANNAARKHSAIKDYLNAKRISPADFQKLLYDYERPLKKSLNIELRGLKNLLKKI